MKKTLSSESQKQLCSIEQSQKYILAIAVAILLSYQSIEVQKKQLLCDELCGGFDPCHLDPFPLKISSNLIIVSALIFFYLLSQQALCQPATSCVQKCSAKANHISSFLVLVAGIVRLWDVVNVKKHAENSNKCAQC